VVLLDEVEALAVSRNGASLETNPVDVHRATDAVLAGVDRVARDWPNVTFVATTNRPLGVDTAFLSRADLVEEIGYPSAHAVRAILEDTLRDLAPSAAADTAGLRVLAAECAEQRLDARQVRKLVLRALCSRRDLVLDPAALRIPDVLEALGRPDPANEVLPVA
jgi:AAA+ superfamily predicted ATPase